MPMCHKTRMQQSQVILQKHGSFLTSITFGLVMGYRIIGPYLSNLDLLVAAGFPINLLPDKMLLIQNKTIEKCQSVFSSQYKKLYLPIRPDSFSNSHLERQGIDENGLREEIIKMS